MINTSAEYKIAITGERNFCIDDKITFPDGTIIHATKENNDLMSYSINSATSGSGNFEIGAAVIKKHMLQLNNMNDKYSSYDFTDADIRAQVGLQLENRREMLRKGTYRVVSAKTTGLTIDIEAYDYMLFFDQPYSKSTLSYPATINEIIADACRVCQMTYSAKTITLGDYEVTKRPDDEALTFRDMISYCAQIMCRFARINNLDELEFGWYNFDELKKISIINGGDFKNYQSGDKVDGGNFKDYQNEKSYDGGNFKDYQTVHHIYTQTNQTINTDDVTITGIKVSVEKEYYLHGEEGYVIAIESNPLIAPEQIQSVAESIGGKMVGRKFRPLSVSCQSDPSIEEGDIAVITDRKNNSYATVITNQTFTAGGLQNISCEAQTKVENNYTRYGAVTKVLASAKEQTQVQLKDYDLAAQQLGSIMAHSMGTYSTTEIDETDGSEIRYMHDKPLLKDSKTIWKQTLDAFAVSTDGGENWNSGMDKNGNVLATVLTAIGISFDWARGGTLTLGGVGNKSGVMKLLDKNEKVIMTLNENGLNVIKGIITGSTITLGGNNNENGTLTVKNASGSNVAIIDSGGVRVYKGSIQGSSVIVGGNNNESGSITVKDSNGEVIANINNAGIKIAKGDIKGTTVTAGGLNDVNGKILVKNSDNSNVVVINSDGISIKKGSIALSSSSYDDNITFSISDTRGKTKTIINSTRLEMGTRDNGLSFEARGDLGGSPGVSVYADGKESYMTESSIHSTSVEATDISIYNDAYISGNTTIYGQLNVVGSKSRISKTQNYGMRHLYCYEMSSPVFGDIGSGMTSESGDCYVFIEDTFKETIDATYKYSVFLQKLGDGNLWVDEIAENYFKVKGTPNLPFSWEIKSKQCGYNLERLEQFKKIETETETEIDYEYQATRYLNNYEKELISYE